jgi:hypothetical protein
MIKSSFATACSEVVPAIFACGDPNVEYSETLLSACNEDRTTAALHAAMSAIAGPPWQGAESMQEGLMPETAGAGER